MKRVLALLLCLAFILTGCGKPTSHHDDDTTNASTTDAITNSEVNTPDSFELMEINYLGLNDDRLLNRVENLVYTEALRSLDSEKYVLENVQAVFISKEYIDEVMFNSQSNVYFGYTLDELNDIFQGTRYVFTLGDDGQTTVQPLVEIEDASAEKILKNVAIGAGVILVCVTVSYVTAGLGAPAVSMIFAASAKTGALMAVSSAAFGGVTAGIVRGIETGDMNEAIKAAEMASSEGFKWGAISGAVIGGGEEAFALKAATKNGLTMNQVAQIQKESKYPLSLIKQFHTMDEYSVFQKAGLQAELVGKDLALVRTDIDLYNVVDEYGRNNFARMSQGLNPIDELGNTYEWHHIGQENNATLALLTQTEHDASSLHGFKVVSEIDRAAFNEYKKILNNNLLKWLLANA